MPYAPIVIITLYRYKHLKLCLSSLIQCTGFERSDVYIVVDYPIKEEHREGYNQICDYIAQLCEEYKNITIIKRQNNYGPIMNLSDAYNCYIKPHYQAWIFSEDDNVFSQNFLEFINYHLAKYETDDTIHAVCGYNYPIYDNQEDVIYKSYMYSPWGVGFWVRKGYDVTIDELYTYMKSIKKAFSIFKQSKYLFHMNTAMLYSHVFYGDSVLRTRLLLNQQSCIFPLISKVRNIGFDNTGINCQSDGGVHQSQVIDTNITYKEPAEDKNIIRSAQYKSYFRIPISTIMKSVIKYILWRVRV